LNDSTRLAPPASLGEVQQVYQQLWTKARDVGYWRDTVKNGQWLRVAVYAAEAYGIFCIGEMSGSFFPFRAFPEGFLVGRRHVVGYALDGPKVHAEGH
jgi:F-type H+-transporting ATPase subunit g